MEQKTPRVEINSEECKGCQLCISQCPKKCLYLSSEVNHMGYNFSCYTGEGCIGCGTCYYACPEPGTITVYKKEK